jgi:hypothetical protein
MTRRTRTQPASSENIFNDLDLMAAVLAPGNLRRAWQRVKSNKGTPDIDGLTIEDFAKHARAHWSGIRQKVEQGKYQPTAVRRVNPPASPAFCLNRRMRNRRYGGVRGLRG